MLGAPDGPFLVSNIAQFRGGIDELLFSLPIFRWSDLHDFLAPSDDFFICV